TKQTGGRGAQGEEQEVHGPAADDAGGPGALDIRTDNLLGFDFHYVRKEIGGLIRVFRGVLGIKSPQAKITGFDVFQDALRISTEGVGDSAGDQVVEFTRAGLPENRAGAGLQGLAE